MGEEEENKKGKKGKRGALRPTKKKLFFLF
jgi:hypothetical protein